MKENSAFKHIKTLLYIQGYKYKKLVLLTFRRGFVLFAKDKKDRRIQRNFDPKVFVSVITIYNLLLAVS